MNFIKLTIWFTKESRNFIGPFELKDYLYFPIAYIRFMYFSYAVK